MKIGSLYFDEKDLLLVVGLVILAALQFLNIELILFFTVVKLFIVLFLSFLARIFYGKTREGVVFFLLFFGILASTVLSYPGLAFFMIISYVLCFYLFKY